MTLEKAKQAKLSDYISAATTTPKEKILLFESLTFSSIPIEKF